MVHTVPAHWGRLPVTASRRSGDGGACRRESWSRPRRRSHRPPPMRGLPWMAATRSD